MSRRSPNPPLPHTAPYNEEQPRFYIAELVRPARGLATYEGIVLMDGEPIAYTIADDVLTIKTAVKQFPIVLIWSRGGFGYRCYAQCPRCYRTCRYLIWYGNGFSCYGCSPVNESAIRGYKARQALKVARAASYLGPPDADGVPTKPNPKGRNDRFERRLLDWQIASMSARERYENRVWIAEYIASKGRKHL